MAKARKANKTNSKMGVLVYGEQFTGKSTLGMQFAYFNRPDGSPYRVLYLDCEAGSIDDYIENLENDGINTENIYIVYTQSLSEVKSYIAKVKNNEDFYALDDEGNETTEIVLDAEGKPFRADAIVLDGTTILAQTLKQSLIEFSKKRNTVKAKKKELTGIEKTVTIEGSGLELKDYQVIGYKAQDLILDLMACGVNYLVTAREKDETISIKDDKGAISNVATGKKIPDGFKGMEYNVKTVIRMFRNDDNVVCGHVKKDRMKAHEDNSIVEDISLLDWKNILDHNSKNASFSIKNDLDNAVDIEQKLYEKEVLTSVGETIEEEKKPESNSDITTAITEIGEIMKGLSAIKKKSASEQLEAKGYPSKPSGIKAITDINTLNEIKELLATV